MTGPKSGWFRLAKSLYWRWRLEQIRRKNYEGSAKWWRNRAMDAEMGARDISRAMDAVLVRVCLELGQEMPNGGHRISLSPPSVRELETWRVTALRGEDGDYQVMVQPREKRAPD